MFNMPTRWQIKEKWYSCGDMKIKDAFNNDVFQIECLTRYWPASMRIIDLRTGLEACYIEQKVSRFFLLLTEQNILFWCRHDLETNWRSDVVYGI